MVRWGDNQDPLVEGTDYSVAYKNNKNAGTMQAVITGKGNYTSESKNTAVIERTIYQRDLSEAVAKDLTMKQNATTEPAPVITWNGKALKKGTDFTIEATLWSGNYGFVIAEGINNYTGTIAYSITKIDGRTVMDANSLTVKLDNSKVTFDAEKTEMKPSFTVKYKTETIQINPEGTNSSSEKLGYEFVGNDSAGTAYLVVTPAEDESIGGQLFAGSKVLKFTIAPAVKFAASGSAKNVFVEGTAQYDGTPKTVEDLTNPVATPFYIVNGETILNEGEDYILTYKNNVKAGNATITVTGIGKYAGAKVNTKMVIAKPVIQKTDLEMSAESFPYTKGGVKPAGSDVVITVNGRELVQGVDYTLTYKDNNTVGDALLTVKGKGNYVAGNEKNIGFTKAFAIESGVFTESNIYVKPTEVAYNTRNTTVGSYTQNGRKRPTVVDLTTGKNLAAADFDVEWQDSADTVDVSTGYTWITATIVGKGLYAGAILSSVDTLKVYDKNASTKLTKAMFKAIPNQIYTGYAITVDDILEATSDSVTFEVVPNSYKNNVKRGTASVTVQGTGKCYGTVTLTFKISGAEIKNLD